ncbi:MAG: tRNA (5-methylaminomethyl-2-thiouridine)(34)-methyltransferase MnmD [Saprospiraceae bacterium]
MPDNQLIITEDGSHSLFSQKHGVSYHSKYGAVQETQHVFINAGFQHKIPTAPLSILGIGFGTGLNAFMTFLESKKHKVDINYTGVEAYPLSLDTINEFNFSEILKEDESVFQKIHELDWEVQHALDNHFQLTKMKMMIEDIDFKNQFDLIYFDAFGPGSQPELWEEPILQKMYNALKTDGVLTTYCAKGSVKRGLKKVGFTIEALPGPPGKREMTRAVKMELPKIEIEGDNSKEGFIDVDIFSKEEVKQIEKEPIEIIQEEISNDCLSIKFNTNKTGKTANIKILGIDGNTLLDKNIPVTSTPQNIDIQAINKGNYFVAIKFGDHIKTSLISKI